MMLNAWRALGHRDVSPEQETFVGAMVEQLAATWPAEADAVRSWELTQVGLTTPFDLCSILRRSPDLPHKAGSRRRPPRSNLSSSRREVIMSAACWTPATWSRALLEADTSLRAPRRRHSAPMQPPTELFPGL